MKQLPIIHLVMYSVKGETGGATNSAPHTPLKTQNVTTEHS